MIELNKIYNEDCLEGMKRIPDGSVDLTVTSPPYDNLRTYNGNIEQWSFEKFQAIAKELYRVTKQGGVVVWVVGDATIKGSETGTSFRQALYFKEVGFNLHDTMIYYKACYPPLTHNRYEQSFEYMFVFSKGKPQTFNPIMVECMTKGTKRPRQNSNKEHGAAVRNDNRVDIINEFKQKNNIWTIRPNNTHHKHPAMFPEQLANDHILSWSNEGDAVLDPFMGSGTTAIACINTGRNFIGFELDKHYCEIANERIQKALMTRKDYDDETLRRC